MSMYNNDPNFAAGRGHPNTPLPQNRWTSYNPQQGQSGPPSPYTRPDWNAPGPSRHRPHTSIGLPSVPPPPLGQQPPLPPPFLQQSLSDTTVGPGPSQYYHPQQQQYHPSPNPGWSPLPPGAAAPPLPPPPPRSHAHSDSVSSALPSYINSPSRGSPIEKPPSHPSPMRTPASPSGYGPPQAYGVLPMEEPPLVPYKDPAASLPSPPARPPLPPKILLPEPIPPSENRSYAPSPVATGSPHPTNVGATPNGAGDDMDEEMARALRESMESFQAENRRTEVDEDDEARAIRESAEMFAKQQEMEHMAHGMDEDTEEALIARITAMSLEEERQKQTRIEMEIRRSTRAWNPVDENGAGPSQPRFSPEAGPSRPSPTRPTIITSTTSSANPSRSVTPNPGYVNQQSLSPPRTVVTPVRSDTMEWGDMPLPAYEEVASSPSQAMHLSPLPVSPGLTTSLSSPALSPISRQDSLGPGRSTSNSFSSALASPLEISPEQRRLPSPAPPVRELPENEPIARLRTSSSLHSNHGRTPSVTSLGRSPSSPVGGGVRRETSPARWQPAETLGTRAARSSSQPTMARPHTMYATSEDAPPVPPLPAMQMPIPQIPQMPKSASAPDAIPRTSGVSTPQPPGESPAAVKRIQLEADYTDGVSFGYSPPILDQPVLPPPPPFPETVTLLRNSAYHISARNWHSLIRLLARLGVVEIQPSPDTYELLPRNATQLTLRIVLQFHKCKIGHEWRTVMWLDLDRPLPSGLSALENSRFTNGDTTILPYGCQIPEESISTASRGPSSFDISSSMHDVVYVMQAPLPTLPTSLGSIATILTDAYRLSKEAQSTGSGVNSEGIYTIDRGLAQKRLAKAIDKIYPANKRGISVAAGVINRKSQVDDKNEPPKVVTVGGKRGFTGWVRAGMGKVGVGKEAKGGQWKNEEELADLVTPFTL